MPDITMCTGEGCPIKDRCFRHLAKPSFRQSYFFKPPYENGECAHFLPIEEEQPKKLRLEKAK